MASSPGAKRAAKEGGRDEIEESKDEEEVSRQWEVILAQLNVAHSSSWRAKKKVGGKRRSTSAIEFSPGPSLSSALLPLRSRCLPSFLSTRRQQSQLRTTPPLTLLESLPSSARPSPYHLLSSPNSGHGACSTGVCEQRCQFSAQGASTEPWSTGSKCRPTPSRRKTFRSALFLLPSWPTINADLDSSLPALQTPSASVGASSRSGSALAPLPMSLSASQQ